MQGPNRKFGTVSNTGRSSISTAYSMGITVPTRSHQHGGQECIHAAFDTPDGIVMNRVHVDRIDMQTFLCSAGI
jgi:hypothetical protein